MMDDLQLARLRRLATADALPEDVPATMAGEQVRAIIAAAVAEIDEHRRAYLAPPLVVSATQRIDDDRWRNAGDNRARERVLWEGVARDIGKQILAHVDCRVHAGGGLISYQAAAVVLRPPPSLSAEAHDMGGFMVRIVSDNRDKAEAAINQDPERPAP